MTWWLLTDLLITRWILIALRCFWYRLKGLLKGFWWPFRSSKLVKYSWSYGPIEVYDIFLTNLATVLVYGQWRPSDIVLTPGLSFSSAHLFESDRLSRVLSGFPTSYSTLLLFLLQTALLYPIWCFLEVHATSIHDLKTVLQVPLLMFSLLLLWNAPFY